MTRFRWLDVLMHLATPAGRAVLADLVVPPDLLQGLERVVDLASARMFIEDQQTARHLEFEQFHALRAAYDAVLRQRAEQDEEAGKLAARCRALEAERGAARTEREHPPSAPPGFQEHTQVSINLGASGGAEVEVTTTRGQRLVFTADEVRDLFAQLRLFAFIRDTETNDLLRLLSAQAVAQVDEAIARLQRELAPMRGGR